MRQMLIAPLIGAALVLAGAGPAAADRPVEMVLYDEAFDIDPCTDLGHTISITIQMSVHQHGDNTVAHGVTSLSTSLGYTGGGTSSYVWNGNVEKFRVLDQLSDDSGNRIRAHVVFVADLRTDTIRVEHATLECVTP